ncbi:hypothetical protein F5Y19DRAFT_486013 [Xylariaceae sp. FL1651]|nr:hypothetical protein F5Y19DRAFT_486013 [Xylariaceae sp. FL1651]
MKLLITIISFLFLSPHSSTHFLPNDVSLVPATAAGNTNCSTTSLNTTFQLTFISYGNWTALPSQDDQPIQRLESISFAVTNEANGVATVCALPIGVTLSGNPVVLDDLPSSAYPTALIGLTSWAVVTGKDDVNMTAGAVWQACADRKDTDGIHQFTIATGAAFGLSARSLAVNQTWFCHDDAGRLVAYTGVASTTLNMTCSESDVSGYHLQNCTSPDLRLPATLL